MTSVSAPAGGETKKLEIPALIHISKEILDVPGKQPEAHQQSCLILDLPPELLRKVIKSKELSVFDTACLMLTCKAFARYVTTFQGKVALGQEVLSGEEEGRLEMLMMDGPDEHYSEGDSMYGSDSDREETEAEKEWDRKMCVVDEQTRSRVDPKEITDFYQRLDRGWNNGGSRFCFSCGMFRSTSQAYWDRKIQKYMFRTTSKVGRELRFIRDCECNHFVQDIIGPWVKYEDRRGEEIESSEPWSGYNAGIRYILCPDCAVTNGAGCDCDYMYDHECACLCRICRKGCV